MMSIEEERPSFLKKRSKKLLCLLVCADRKSATANKSFLLLFFKKEDLAFLQFTRTKVKTFTDFGHPARYGAHFAPAMP